MLQKKNPTAAPLCFCHFKRRHQCASFGALLDLTFRYCNTTCGSNDGGLSVIRQMQTAGEVFKHAALPLQKTLNSIKDIIVCSLECDCNQRAAHQLNFGGKFTLLDHSLLLKVIIINRHSFIFYLSCFVFIL